MPSTDLDEHDLYVIVRLAIRDAIWDVIGTILTVALTVVVLFAGAGFVAQGLRSGAGSGWLAIAFGLVVMTAAVVYFLRDFGRLPFTGGGGHT